MIDVRDNAKISDFGRIHGVHSRGGRIPALHKEKRKLLTIHASQHGRPLLQQHLYSMFGGGLCINSHDWFGAGPA